jgi:hypothetical protein
VGGDRSIAIAVQLQIDIFLAPMKSRGFFFVYHIGIIAGLDIIERYNHSVDIYTDDTRFAPLGTDATVVYGYKDLRIRNNTNVT